MPTIQTQTIPISQQSFDGGMRRSIDPTKLGDNEYTLGINIRSRFGTIKPVLNPLRLTDGLTDGNYQGIYGAGPIVVVFINGQAYYRDFSNSGVSFFAPIAGFQMSVAADRLYAELVPAATAKLKRVPVDANDKSSGIKLTSAINSSPQCLIVQDGVNQPMGVNPDGSIFTSQTWAEWTDGNREYVPVGKQMMYSGGKLYIVSKDGQEIYHSVTGRPLDFIIAVDSAGLKFGSEEESGAPATSHRVDYDTISAISRLNLGSGGFFVTTNKNSFLVTPDTEKTVYGEPTFKNTYLFSTGALNQFSITDILGDTALIDFAGLRSFNAVQQLLVEGNNSPFSADVHALFENVIQSFTCAATFDNYGLFAVTTIFGPAILVYDTLIKKFSSLDIYPGVGLIKQFCEIKLPTERKLLFITTDNKLYQAFSGDTVAGPAVYTREFSGGSINSNILLSNVKAAFLGSSFAGVASTTIYTDRLPGNELNETLNAVTSSPAPSTIIPPWGTSIAATTQNLTFHPQSRKKGWKAGMWIEWTTDAELAGIEVEAQITEATPSTSQQSRAYAGLSS